MSQNNNNDIKNQNSSENKLDTFNMSFSSLSGFLDWLKIFSIQQNHQYYVFSYRLHDKVESKFAYVHYKCIHYKQAFRCENKERSARVKCQAKLKVMFCGQPGSYRITDAQLNHNHVCSRDSYLLNSSFYEKSLIDQVLMPNMLIQESDESQVTMDDKTVVQSSSASSSSASSPVQNASLGVQVQQSIDQRGSLIADFPVTAINNLNFSGYLKYEFFNLYIYCF
jgi:hypothetical protein